MEEPNMQQIVDSLEEKEAVALYLIFSYTTPEPGQFGYEKIKPLLDAGLNEEKKAQLVDLIEKKLPF